MSVLTSKARKSIAKQLDRLEAVQDDLQNMRDGLQDAIDHGVFSGGPALYALVKAVDELAATYRSLEQLAQL